MAGEAIQNPVHTLQHGFRTDRNTDTALSSVVNNLEKGTYLDQDTIAIFLDIAAAFDTICPGLIKRKLLEHGGDPYMVNWYYNFITHRNLHVEINGTTASKTVCIGFPQGGVCSAKFWIIAFNEAIEIINSYGAFGNGFADDCVTMLTGTNLKYMMNKLQKVVTCLLYTSPSPRDS